MQRFEDGGLRALLMRDEVVAPFVGIRDPRVPPMLANAGYRHIVIDAEHAVMDAQTVEALVTSAHAAGLSASVRVKGLHRHLLQDALEAGADGIIVPMTEDASMAALAVDWCRYPPEGSRGFHPLTGGSGYGGVPMGRLAVSANASILLAVQIETQSGLNAASEIAEVPGIDMLFFGPGDFSLSTGVAMGGPEVMEAMRRTAWCASREGKLFGTFAMDAKGLQAARSAEARLIIHGSDIAMLAQSFRSGFQSLSD